MRGNFGYNGEEKIIEEIKNSKNTIYLLEIPDNSYQLPNKIYSYFFDNLNYKDDILYFRIYEK